MGSAVGSLIPPGARSFGKYELLARLAPVVLLHIFHDPNDSEPG